VAARRAAIGRTLIGIEETLFHAVFNWYAKVFMQMTMAVSRVRTRGRRQVSKDGDGCASCAS